MLNNPVLRKELLLRFRIRQPLSVKIGLGVLTVVVLGWSFWTGKNGLLNDRTPFAGYVAWQTSIRLQYMVICMVAASLTANAITQEREQQTWEMLVFTHLRPGEIVLGKLIGRLASVALLLAIFLPFTLLTWQHAANGKVNESLYIHLGGANRLLIAQAGASAAWQQLIAAYLVIGVSAVLFAILGLFLSWRLKRTLYALLGSYAVVAGVLCLGTVLGTRILNGLLAGNAFVRREPLMWLNPFRLIDATLRAGDPDALTALACGLMGYLFIGGMLLWHMIARFRSVPQE